MLLSFERTKAIKSKIYLLFYELCAKHCDISAEFHHLAIDFFFTRRMKIILGNVSSIQLFTYLSWIKVFSTICSWNHMHNVIITIVTQFNRIPTVCSRHFLPFVLRNIWGTNKHKRKIYLIRTMFFMTISFRCNFQSFMLYRGHWSRILILWYDEFSLLTSTCIHNASITDNQTILGTWFTQLKVCVFNLNHRPQKILLKMISYLKERKKISVRLVIEQIDLAEYYHRICIMKCGIFLHF